MQSYRVHELILQSKAYCKVSQPETNTQLPAAALPERLLIYSTNEFLLLFQDSIKQLKDSTKKLLCLLEDIQVKANLKDFPISDRNQIKLVQLQGDDVRDVLFIIILIFYFCPIFTEFTTLNQ